MVESDKPFCFVISPVGDPGTEKRRRANGVLREIIRPALSNFRVERADHEKTPGIVTEGIINKIIDADLVVADLTEKNPNVMYELAVRHALGKPFVQMMEEGEELPFDIGPANTVFFRSDLNGRSKAEENLREAAERAMETGDVGNPIRRTVQFRGLKPEEGSEGELLLAKVQDLRSQVGELRYDTSRSRRKGASLLNVEGHAEGPSVSLLGPISVANENMSVPCLMCGRQLTSDNDNYELIQLDPGTGHIRTKYLCQEDREAASTDPKAIWDLLVE